MYVHFVHICMNYACKLPAGRHVSISTCLQSGAEAQSNDPTSNPIDLQHHYSTICISTITFGTIYIILCKYTFLTVALPASSRRTLADFRSP